jgi:hypothetical protein
MADIVRNRRNAFLGARELGFQPRSLDGEKLRGLNHAEWLEDFSQILALQTGVQMTPKREGTITRLHWAADYVKLLEQQVRDLEVEIKKLRSDADPEGR